jgi:hypothetical protein
MIAPGRSALLVGRIERVGDRARVSYSGAEALMYFVTRGEIDPATEARAYLRRRARTYAFMIVLALLAFATSLWFIGHFPSKS